MNADIHVYQTRSFLWAARIDTRYGQYRTMGYATVEGALEAAASVVEGDHRRALSESDEPMEFALTGYYSLPMGKSN